MTRRTDALRRLRLAVWLAAAVGGAAQAQPFERAAAPFPVVGRDGRAVRQPFVGGFFEPRPQLADLDGDGDADLVVSVGGAGLQVFAWADGRFVWQTDRLDGIEPGSWAAFGDLDGDGDLDLLTRGIPGHARFYRNVGTARAPTFVLAADTLALTGGGFLRVEDSSVPDLADLDGDGDLDLLAGKADLGTLTFYRHDGTGPDGLPRFTFVTDTYQDIQIYEANPSCTAGGGLGARPAPLPVGLGRPSLRHGANALTLADVTDDGRPDLFWGDFFSPSLYFFQNRGTAQAPDFALVTDRYPLDAPVLSGGFNVPAFGDADGDGDLDLVVGVQRGLCFQSVSAVENLGFFENDGGTYVPTTFRLIDAMDEGARSTGALADLDGDGDLDLLTANETAPSLLGRASLQLYRNVGTADAPSLRIEDDDYLALDYDYGGYAPTLGDLDGDGDLDLLVGGFNGRFAFLRNTGSRQQPAFTLVDERFEGIDVGQYARGSLGDLDGDGTLDLVAGASNGLLFLYRNAGTPEGPAYAVEPNGQATADDQAFAIAIGLPAQVGSDAAPALADLDGDGDLDLLVGTAQGEIRVYTNVGSPTAPRFSAADPIPAARRRTTPFAGDLDGDGRPEVLAGADAGGFLFWHNGRPAGTPADAPVRGQTGLRVIPNPSTGTVSFRAGPDAQGEVAVLDARGREVARVPLAAGDAEWDGRDGSGARAPAGVYLARLEAGGAPVTVAFTRL